MVCACHTNLGLSTLLFMARTNHMLHTECSNGAAIDCTVDFTSLRTSVNIYPWGVARDRVALSPRSLHKS